MNNAIGNTTLLAACFLLLFGLAEILYHKFAVRVEYTRKIVHLGTGLLTLLFPLLLDNHWLVLFLCASFLLILIASIKLGILRSINAIDRISYGSISYPIAVYGCYLAYNYFNNNLVFFYLPILVLAICDPLAALIGKKIPIGKFKIIKDTKTMVGTGSFFISSFILSLVILYSFDAAYKTSSILLAVTIAAFTSAVEAISIKGLDNITIPVTVISILILFI